MVNYKKIIFWVFLLFSLVCIACGVKLLARYVDLKNNGLKTQAILIGYDAESVQHRNSSESTYYKKIFKYKAGNDSITSSPNTSSKDADKETGTTEEIIYSSDDPTVISEVNELNSDLTAGIVVVVLGLLFASVVVFVNLKFRKKVR